MKIRAILDKGEVATFDTGITGVQTVITPSGQKINGYTTPSIFRIRSLEYLPVELAIAPGTYTVYLIPDKNYTVEDNTWQLYEKI